MIQIYELDNFRTKGSKQQWQYDNILADMSISSLRFLKYKYKQELKKEQGVNLPADLYRARKEKERRYNMINEELHNREMNKNSFKYRLTISNWYIDNNDVYGYFNEDYTKIHGEIIQNEEEYL